MIPETLKENIRQVIKTSQRFHLVACATVVAPAILLSTYFLVPILMAKNLGWSYFQTSCLAGFGVAFGGIVLWALEPRNRRAWQQWVFPTVLAGVMILALIYLIKGTFYWAFDQGYFVH